MPSMGRHTRMVSGVKNRTVATLGRCTVRHILLAAVLVSWFSHADSFYTSDWAVRIEGGPEVAQRVAERNGFTFKYEILKDYYLFSRHRIAKRSAEPSHEHHHLLSEEPEVRWVEQQKVKRRVKRDFKENFVFKHRSTYLVDPKWPAMWYLNRGGGLDMNVQKAWAEGVTGKDVVVTILDDGLEKDHPDLRNNYDPLASFDMNNDDADPTPRYDLVDSNRHGTRCAGVVAADANNAYCAVGVAFEAKVGGVRMLDGDVTDAVEARSLSFHNQHIDIYTVSWGPDDDGKTVDGPGALATRAFTEGILNGRSGKGSIFVWASGNGGRDNDNCNCDGYTNSIWTLSVNSATENGHVPWYSETCSSTLATTYSSGSMGEKQIVTTDLHHSCTLSHTGTAGSSTLAAGICALALQVNPSLTWRDMQHIVVRTARPANLKAPDWQTNAVGRNVSHSFGYGLMDAAAMVTLARRWVSVPEQNKCEIPSPHRDKLIPAYRAVSLKLDVLSCPGVVYLEHVQAKVTLSATRRGFIQIYLISPGGTNSTLLTKRPRDASRLGYKAWPFMSVHNWGETPIGVWHLEIHNKGRYVASISRWGLILHGTATEPGVHHTETSTLSSSPPAAAAPAETGVHSSSSSSSFSYSTTSATFVAAPSSIPEGSLNCLKLGAGRCLACDDGWYLYEGKCVQKCGDGMYPSADIDSGSPAACISCHCTCGTCSGPHDYQCLSCHGGSVLHLVTEGESYCHPKQLMVQLESEERRPLEFTSEKTGMVILFFGLAAVIVGLIG